MMGDLGITGSFLSFEGRGFDTFLFFFSGGGDGGKGSLLELKQLEY